MNPGQSTTRDRLIRAATHLFALHGLKGASVRDICDLARANAGAISYHFGGKRQLYSVVMLQAAERLAASAAMNTQNPHSEPTERIVTAVQSLLAGIENDPESARLFLRDLADGGSVAVQALAPLLRDAYTALLTAAGFTEDVSDAASGQALFAKLAAPLFLLTAAWPVVERTLGLQATQRAPLVTALARDAVTSTRHSS